MGDISRSSSQLIWNELIWDVSEHIPKEAVYDIGVRLETQHSGLQERKTNKAKLSRNGFWKETRGFLGYF